MLPFCTLALQTLAEMFSSLRVPLFWMVAATFWEVTPLMVILPLRVVPLRVEPLKFDTSMRPLSVVRLAVCAETPSSVMLSLVVLTVMFASVWRGTCSVRVQLRVSWLWMTREALGSRVLVTVRVLPATVKS